MYPLYEELMLTNVDDVIKLFADKKDLMVLTSTQQMQGFGRYSFICFDSFWTFSLKNTFDTDPFICIQQHLDTYKIEKIDTLPPFQGGLMGYLGYEASHYLETLPFVLDNIQLPDIYLNSYSSVIAFDHHLNQSWVIATGFPEQQACARIKKATQDIHAIKMRLTKGLALSFCTSSAHKIVHQPLSNFDKASYMQAVNTTKDYILNGDIFEANISQQFHTILTDSISPIELYFDLVKHNPAPFSAFLRIDEQGYIISASPERFIQLTHNKVETSPIKGTKKRAMDPVEDKRLADELSCSEKDRAEHVMIVDLMRNDLSRVCHSVNVDELFALKSFKTVHHLVSTITGILKPDITSIDLIKATFPPGSVTGAPKIRSMEIISELEKQARGPYCGCMGYISFTGDLDLSVTIRSYYINGTNLFFSAGGAVVLDSDPHEEYQESLTKLSALLKALTT